MRVGNITLRPYQEKMINGVRRSLSRNKRVILQMETGCHEKGHPILMADGSIRRVEDVLVGDLVMGPDSKPRTVTELHRGVDEMFRVTPTKGEPFVVNAGHIFHLYLTPKKKGEAPGYVEASAREVSEWSAHIRHGAKLHRKPVTMEERELPIDPWLLGVLIGDGSLTSSCRMSTADQEVVDRVARLVAPLGLSLKASDQQRTAPTYRITAGRTGGADNPLWSALRAVGLAGKGSGEKFVPLAYKTSSTKQRLELLAGIMDTDGHARRGGYDWISKSERLADDVVFLCRSVGLAAYKSRSVKGCQNGFKGVYWRVYVSGDCSIIPCCVPHKVSTKRKQIKNPLVTGFKLEAIGEGDYYGFSLTGDRLYLDGHFVVHHNSGKTACGLYMMHSAVQRGNNAMFIVHQKELLAQTEEAFWKQGLAHGVIGAGRSRSRSQAQLAMIQTLHNRVQKGQAPPADFILIDECHRSLSPTYMDVIHNYYPNAVVVGLSATPWRTDGRPLRELYGDIVLGPPPRELINCGALCDYELFGASIRGANTDGIRKRGDEYDLSQVAAMFEERQVYGDAVSHYMKLTPGKRCVVMCNSIKEAKAVADAYNARGIPAASIEGSMTDSERAAIIKDLASGKLRVVTNVQLLIEGVDIPAIEVVQWLRPTLSLIVSRQGNGRGLRPSPCKDKLIILDHVSNFVEHGMPCEEIEWSLDGRPTRKDEREKSELTDGGPSLASCHECFKVYEAHLERCPYCGAENKGLKRRQLELIEGELERIEIEKAKLARMELRQRQGHTRDLAGLVKLYEAAGNKYPDRQAAHVLAGREKRKATDADFREAAEILKEVRARKAAWQL